MHEQEGYGETLLQVRCGTRYTSIGRLGAEKPRNKNDGLKFSIVPTFNGCPIPSDLVIVNVGCEDNDLRGVLNIADTKSFGGKIAWCLVTIHRHHGRYSSGFRDFARLATRVGLASSDEINAV